MIVWLEVVLEPHRPDVLDILVGDFGLEEEAAAACGAKVDFDQHAEGGLVLAPAAEAAPPLA
eukprot:6711962-Alexandrium_andersonii.AAC.1